ncbi:MAG TPA: hypothetical protein DD729_08245 [Rhodobacteraceae bacterium]|nr:hypothetical protein [Paracoccaceae bacterium]
MPIILHHCAQMRSMRSPVVMKLETVRQAKCFGVLEDQLQGHEYLLDGGFGAVDISVGQAVCTPKVLAELNHFQL